MRFNTFTLAALAAATASAQAPQASLSDACAAGAILGIYALCGSRPVDCGSGKCCLEGQTCVKADSDFKCADPALVKGATVTVNAACYGTASPPSSTSGSASPTPSKSGKPSSPYSAVPSASASISKPGYGSGSSTGSNGGVFAPTASSGPIQSQAGTGSEIGPKPTGGFTSPFTNGTVSSILVVPSVTSSRSPVLATANAAPGAHLPASSNFAAMLSGLGLLAYLL